MSNVVLNPGSGGNTIRSVTKSGFDAQVSIIDMGGAGAESLMTAGQAVMASSLPVVIASNQSAIAVTASAGTNLNTSTLALETGGNLATIAGKDFATQTTLAAMSAKIPALGQALAAASVPVVLTAAQLSTLTPLTTVAVTGTFFQSTQPVSAASLPLPSGASTAAKQPALGTAGTASSDVISVQGIASMTPLAVTGTFFQVTQPVSGQVTVNAGTGTTTAFLAVESGGNLATIAGAVTSSIVQANTAKINNVTPLMGNGVTGTGSQRVTIASDNTAFSVNAVQSGTWNVATVTTVTTVAAVTAITNALPAGTNNIGFVSPGAATSGGVTPGRYLAAAAANQDAHSLKGSAGTLTALHLGNVAATGRFYKLYDGSSPTSASTPVHTIFIPAGGGCNLFFNPPLQFSTAITARITVNMVDNDANACSSGDVNASWGAK